MKIKKIDTSKWQPYDLNKLFHIVLPKGDIQEKKIDDGDIPLISAGKINNGIVKYVDKNGDGISTIIDGNCITIDMFGKSFYQEQPFYAVSHGRVNILVPKFELNKNIALFLCSVLDSFGNKYNFKEMCNKARLEKLKITIPIDENDEPDFDKMEDFMIKTENEVKENKKKLDAIIAVVGHKINTSTWKEFDLKDLFEISGSKTTPKQKLNKIGSGQYPYITTQATTNGINGYYNFYTEQGDCLTIDSAVLGTCFYQQENFSASDHVEILRPKFKWNKYIALFLVNMLNQTGMFIYHYSYLLKRSQKQLKQETIPIPTTPNNQPDWKFMEDYIKSLPYGDKI